ncbi:MAG: GTA-gp10 family protein [Pseudomonadota bacterium]
MSINQARGEVGLMINGQKSALCLTLGALAEIEASLGCKTLAELQLRLSALSAGELLTVIAALLRGGGNGDLVPALSLADVSPSAAAKAVAEAFRLGLTD